MVKKVVNYDGFSLEEALVLSAMEDYKQALMADDRKKIRELEEYFRSSDFEELTNLNSDYLIREMRKQVKASESK